MKRFFGLTFLVLGFPILVGAVCAHFGVAIAHVPSANGNNCAGPGRACNVSTVTATNVTSAGGYLAKGTPPFIPSGVAAVMGNVQSFAAICNGQTSSYSLGNCMLYSQGTDTFFNAPAGNNLWGRVGNANRFEWDETNQVLLVKAGGAAATTIYPTPSILYHSITVGNNVSTGETTLDSFSLPANTLNANGRAVRISVHGSFAANANAKTIKLKFGATDGTNGFFTGNYNGSDWTAALTCHRTGAATQVCSSTFGESGGTTRVLGIARAPTETLSGAVTLALTGTGGASNDITSKSMMVEFLP
jgi:hypothetical protein